jgi:hypothetical protein
MSLYQNLPEEQRKLYIAKLIHSLSKDDALFQMGTMIINLGERRGLFKDVSIGNEQVRNAIIENENCVG